MCITQSDLKRTRADASSAYTFVCQFVVGRARVVRSVEIRIAAAIDITTIDKSEKK